MTTLNSVNSGTLTNFGVCTGSFVPQQLVDFSLSADLLFPDSSSLIEFVVGFGYGYGDNIFLLSAQSDGSNLDVTITVGEQDIAPTSGSNTFTLSGNTLSLTGQTSIDVENPISGSVTLTTSNGSVVWQNLGSGVFNQNAIAYWSIGYTDYNSTDYTTTMVGFDFSLQGANENYFSAVAGEPNFGGTNSATVPLSGISYVTPEESSINYILDGGTLTPATNFFLSDVTSSQVVEAVPGGAWTAFGPTVNRDDQTHTITMYSGSDSVDSVAGTFYSGGLFLSLDQLSGVMSGEFPPISGLEGSEIIGSIFFSLDGGNEYDYVSNYVPGNESVSGAWSGTGPSVAGGTHTLQVIWPDSNDYGADSVSSNIITYTVGGDEPARINIMVV
jgi:hypothetical protein